MPQIAQIAETYSSQIFWLLLTFGFVFFVIGLGMVPKVQGTADARDAKISGDLDAAKAAFARADEEVDDERAVGLLAAAAVAAVALSSKSVKAAVPESGKSAGYRETEHVKKYYELARF